jgi:hypothetical protein
MGRVGVVDCEGVGDKRGSRVQVRGDVSRGRLELWRRRCRANPPNEAQKFCMRCQVGPKTDGALGSLLGQRVPLGHLAEGRVGGYQHAVDVGLTQCGRHEPLVFRVDRRAATMLVSRPAHSAAHASMNWWSVSPANDKYDMVIGPVPGEPPDDARVRPRAQSVGHCHVD